MTILVTGATGKVGRHLVRELARHGHPVRALVRNRARATAIEGTGVPMVVGDLDKPETLPPALEGVRRVFLLSSPSPRVEELHGHLVDAAAEAGVAHVVRLSARGADPEGPIALLRWHGQAEKRLEASDLAWTHLRPTFFQQNLLGLAPWIAARGELRVPGGDARVAMIDVRDVARSAAAVLAGDVEDHAGRAYELTGPKAQGFGEVAQVLSAVLGRDVRYVDQDPEEARQAMEGAGVPGWLASGLVELYRLYAERGEEEPTGEVERLTGRPATPLAEVVRRHAAELRGDDVAHGSE